MTTDISNFYLNSTLKGPEYNGSQIYQLRSYNNTRYMKKLTNMASHTLKSCKACMGCCRQDSLPTNFWRNDSTNMAIIRANSSQGYGNTQPDQYNSTWLLTTLA
jgi:hypothetical protein